MWSWLTHLALLHLIPTLVSAYSFNFQNTPTQCGNLTIAITGTGGQAPYRILINPYGQTPLPNAVEARKIIDQAFDSPSSVTLQLKYPANSQFVVVISDASGFGTGGTSVAATVQSSSDASCFNATQSVQTSFAYNIEPANQVVQCNASRLWWDPAVVQGQPRFYGIIPGGNSFEIPVGNITTVPNEGQGFSWVPPLRAGTTLTLGAGDNRGLGSGGSVAFIVSAGPFPDTSCLAADSPHSTPGSPAGGSYPTGTGAPQQGGGGKGGSNVGPIVGGVVGGIVAIAAALLLLLFFRRRQRHHREMLTKERPDLFNDDPPSARDEALPPNLQPEPFIVPELSTHFSPSEAGGTENGGLLASGRYSADDRRNSRVSMSTMDRPVTPSTSYMGGGSSMGTNRKSPLPPALRTVNVIQHDDAGAAPTTPDEEEGDTVELPPAYTNIKRNRTQKQAAPPPSAYHATDPSPEEPSEPSGGPSTTT